MPPKNHKETNDEQKMQAIVLADSFQTRFMPLTSVKPRCLLPLANTPLIDYTLEFLAQTNTVDEIYIMCCSHADQIQEYIDSSKWVSLSSPFKKIQTISSKESRSVGDAMRDIDSRGLITGDFILISGDVVTNLDISMVLENHKTYKQNDRDYICTMVLTQAAPMHRSRSIIEPACFIMDKATNRCLYYQDLPPINGKKTSVNIDPEVLEDIEEFEINNNLIDCHVDICTATVPTIFQENFDYQTLRSDFVKGVLGSDLLKKHIYSYITKDQYSARVESWQTYDGISQDIIERWCYPIVPERNLLQDQTYTYDTQHIYKENNVILSQSCKLISGVVIGQDSFVGDKTEIENSVIGRSCKIGSNVIIENSYIWDGAVIEDNCIIKHSIVANDSLIRKNVILSSGSVIGFGVVIDENVIVGNNVKIIKDQINEQFSSTAISTVSSDLDTDEEDQEFSKSSNTPNTSICDPSVVGYNGVGFLYEEKEYQNDDVLSGGIVYEMAELNLSDASIASSTFTVHHSNKKKRRTHSSASGFISEDEGENFDQEAIATVERAMENNHDLDTAMLELNTLRMSMNVTYHEVRESSCLAMIKRVNHFIQTDTLGVKGAAEKIFRKWGKMFERQVFDGDDQIDLLLILQKTCYKLDSDYKALLFGCIAVILYDIDILDDDNIISWWNSEESKSMPEIREKLAKWIEMLQADSSEEEDEEESDESDNE
jgi:translation initiation factor eIF-2B subunit epsilon